MEVAGSMVYQMPLVVCPTLALRFSYSKVVPNRAFNSVDFPELWEPIIDKA
jgi:D-alanine-D-alanine ligase-like ATP-grasp enzyme